MNTFDPRSAAQVCRFMGVPVGVLAAALFLSGIAGCSRVRRAESDLRDANPVRRAAAAESLGVWRAMKSGPRIRPLLNDSVPGVRERAAEALGQLGDSTAVPALLALILDEDDAGVRRAAAQALAALMPDTSVEAIIPFLQGPTATVSLRAALALTELVRAADRGFQPATNGHLGRSLGGVVQSGQARREELPGNWQAWDDYVRGLIASGDTSEVVTDQAAVGLAWLGGEAAGRGLLTAIQGTITPTLRDSLLAILVLRNDSLVTRGLIADSETNVVSSRRRAIRLLGGLPNALVLEALLSATGDPALDIRREAWNSLLRVHGLRPPLGDSACPKRHFTTLSPALLAKARHALNDADPHVAVSAAIALVHAEERAGVRALVECARQHPQVLGAVCAALADVPRSLTTVPSDVVAPVIVRGVASPDLAVRIAAARALGRWDVPDSALLLQLLLKAPEPEVVRAALQAIGERKDASFLADALSLFGADSLTRMQAAQTVAALVDVHSFNYLILALTTDQLDRRRAAVEAVGLVALGLWGTKEAKDYAPLFARAKSWLTRMAGEELDPQDRAHALWALSYIPSQEEAEDLGIGLGDTAEAVRVMAAVNISRKRPELSIASLQDIVVRGAEPSRVLAAHALAEMGTPEAREVLRMVGVADPSPELRHFARAHSAPR